ncbi:MAG: hypothetical protein FWD45_01380, partial [Coriobacteriia bacterium]|nr:hypothetical protein [Coriobacteriia bacterium]
WALFAEVNEVFAFLDEGYVYDEDGYIIGVILYAEQSGEARSTNLPKGGTRGTWSGYSRGYPFASDYADAYGTLSDPKGYWQWHTLSHALYFPESSSVPYFVPSNTGSYYSGVGTTTLQVKWSGYKYEYMKITSYTMYCSFFTSNFK